MVQYSYCSSSVKIVVQEPFQTIYDLLVHTVLPTVVVPLLGCSMYYEKKCSVVHITSTASTMNSSSTTSLATTIIVATTSSNSSSSSRVYIILEALLDCNGIDFAYNELQYSFLKIHLSNFISAVLSLERATLQLEK